MTDTSPSVVEVEKLVERLRQRAQHLYMWPRPEQTDEWKAADLIERLTLPVDETELVERMARAISEHTFANTQCGPATDCAEWEDMTDYDRLTYRRAATAALSIVRPLLSKEKTR